MAARSAVNCSVSANISTYFIARAPSTWLLEQCGHPAAHLVGADVLDVGGDGPAVAERVDDERVPVTVELVLRRPDEGRAEFDGVRDDGVDVGDVDELEHRGAGQPA